MELVHHLIHHGVLPEAMAHPEMEGAVRPAVREAVHPEEESISVVHRVIETLFLLGARISMALIGSMAISQNSLIGAMG